LTPAERAGPARARPGPGAKGPANLAPGGLAPTWLHALLQRINALMLLLSMLAMVAACAVLTGSVVLRYFLHVPTDWQDEVAVFLLVFVTFGSGAWVQQQRGHIGIEAVSALLSARANRVRERLCDGVSLAFCGFFAWKSWTLVHEAWAEGMTTSSTWAPPLWFPYGLMACGMSLLALQLLLQVLAGSRRREDGT
jgi:TRAP-type C4-dicarboxylate transport system permease small subunit